MWGGHAELFNESLSEFWGHHLVLCNDDSLLTFQVLETVPGLYQTELTDLH